MLIKLEKIDERVKEGEQNILHNTDTAGILFYWAVFAERVEIAKILWRFGKVLLYY
jgi:hypothetical protein